MGTRRDPLFSGSAHAVGKHHTAYSLKLCLTLPQGVDRYAV